jgi:hypothetical protein
MNHTTIHHSRVFEVAIAALFLVAVPLVAHLMFSWMGFNPTDDGFTLAYSRRILDGEIPHRDFIIIRPFVSPLIHVPFVLWGGSYTFWISRLFVWFQLGAISLLWVSIIGRLLRRSFTAPARFLLALTVFAASAHDFPIMAWHTIDGLLLVSLGVWLVVGRRAYAPWIGYLLIGTAALCKQNFVLMIPAALFILGDWRAIKYWLVSGVPAVLYVMFVTASGAAPDALIQLSSHGDLISTGFVKYLRRWMPLGIPIGYYSLHLLLDPPGKHAWVRDSGRRRMLGLWGLYGVPICGVAISLACGYLFKSSFILFGIVAGILWYGFKSAQWKLSGGLRAALLIVTVAWCSSISLGYNSPVLMAGPLLLAVLVVDGVVGRQTTSRTGRPVFLAGVAAVVVLGFVVGRYTHIYREQSVFALTEPLDDVVPGGRLIETNPNTHRYLADLRGIIDSLDVGGSGYVLLPGSPGLWVKSKRRNLLPIDWVQETELNRRVLIDRVINTLDILRDSTTVIVQKIMPKRLAEGFAYVVDEDFHEVVRHIREQYTKVGETAYHELYR